MDWKRLLLVAAVLSLLPAVAAAQRRAPRAGGTHRLEITPFGGYVWTFARDFYLGTTAGRADIKDSGMWGIALDYNMPYKPGSQIHLLYNRQDSKLQFATVTLPRQEVDFGVEYWHVGGSYGIRRGDLLPFTMLTLGGTRYFSGDLDDDVWKFSIMFGAGAKLYANEKFGLKVQGRFPFSIFSGGGAVGCGTGGCYTSVGGSGVAQFDLSAGVMILL